MSEARTAKEAAYDEFGALALTSEQAAQLEDRPARARTDADAAEDARRIVVTTAVRHRCGSCAMTIDRGEQAVMFMNARDVPEVYLHAGPCPDRCEVLVRRAVPSDAGEFTYSITSCDRAAIGTAADGRRVCGWCAEEIGRPVEIDGVRP